MVLLFEVVENLIVKSVIIIGNNIILISIIMLELIIKFGLV